jgi:hypothetical protein
MQSTFTPFDRAVARVLRVTPPAPILETDINVTRGAENTFGLALFFAGVRCILEYVVLPFLLPVLGLTGKFGAPIVLGLNLIALVSLVYSVRKFYEINYKHKRAYLFVSLVAGAIMVAFIVLNLQTMLS